MGLESMSNVIILGAQWGDEGKGRSSTCFASASTSSPAYQGGHNADTPSSSARRSSSSSSSPSGILRGKRAVLGNGMVIDPAALLDRNRNARTGRPSDPVHPPPPPPPPPPPHPPPPTPPPPPPPPPPGYLVHQKTARNVLFRATA